VRPLLPILATLASFAAPIAACATTPLPPPPHTPQRAGCALEALAAAIDGKDHSFFLNGPKIYSEKLGEVAYDELDAFFAEFAAAPGRKSAQPLSVLDWGILEISGTSPLYVMTLQRGGGDGAHWSTWLIQFASDAIVSVRRADELWPFADHRHRFASDDCSKARLYG
jgi:hypothetical protein